MSGSENDEILSETTVINRAKFCSHWLSHVIAAENHRSYISCLCGIHHEVTVDSSRFPEYKTEIVLTSKGVFFRSFTCFLSTDH